MYSRDYYKFQTMITSKSSWLAVSFVATNSVGIAKLRGEWKKMDHSRKRYLGRTKSFTARITNDELGGSIALINLSNLDSGILSEIPVPTPLGMVYYPPRKSLLAASDTEVIEVKNGKIISRLTDRLFKDLHDVKLLENNNLLVTSTGVDGVIEFELTRDHSLKKVWEWLATEHGFDRTPTNKIRTIDRHIDFRKMSISTPEQTTHINSCIPYKEDKLLATLFHQGALIEIDKTNDTSRVVLDGLSSPHNIRTYRDFFLLSDTRANRVLVLDTSFRIKKSLSGDFNWVQDALITKDGDYIIGDSNNGKIVIFSSGGKEAGQLSWDTDQRRLGGFLEIKDEEMDAIFR